MIWEHTWPEPRIIEAAICEDETTVEYTDIAILRFAGPMSVCLDEKDFWSRVVEGRPLNRCSHPVALQVCRESRRHALTKYRTMEHTNSLAGWFYFNPCRDVLWFSFDFMGDFEVQTYLRDLESCYGGQLSTIETVLVEELEWNEKLLSMYSLLYTKPLSGLKAILLLLDDDNEDDDSQEEGTEEDKESDDQQTQSQDEELRERADELREEYADFLEYKGGTWPNVLCMDRTGTIY